MAKKNKKKNLQESMKGNQNSKKLTTDELKKAAYDQYCAHLAKGKSKRSWCFEHPDLTLTWQTMEKYIAEEWADFNPIQMEVAQCKGYFHWENVVEDSAKGVNKDANTASLQMVMRNKFGWDKENHVSHSVEPEVRQLLKKWKDS